jgi:hypothetical protein
VTLWMFAATIRCIGKESAQKLGRLATRVACASSRSAGFL